MFADCGIMRTLRELVKMIRLFTFRTIKNRQSSTITSTDVTNTGGLWQTDSLSKRRINLLRSAGFSFKFPFVMDGDNYATH
jgi:hypothetical protein